MCYAMDGSGFIILSETPYAESHVGSKVSNGVDFPLSVGMLSFGNMGRVTAWGRKR